MAAQPRVSVVMAVLDPHPDYFPAAVESVLEQTLADFELIVVEEPSPNSAGRLLEKYAGDRRIRHALHPQRTSLTEQLNRGLALAQGDLVARFDADDICLPERLARQVEFLDAHPEVGVVGSRIRVIDAAGQLLGYRDYPCQHEAIVAALQRFNALSHPSVMFRKQLVCELGAYQYRRHPAEDYELWCRLAHAGVRFANLAEPLLSYRVHAGASKSQKMRATIRGTIDVKRLHWAGQLNWHGRARLLAEHALLWLPAPLVHKLFQWSTYRRADR